MANYPYQQSGYGNVPAQYNPMYNPNLEYYNQRMNTITNYNPPQGQQFNNPQAQQYNNQQPQTQMVCRPVTSIDEAKAAMIDAFNVYVFTDFANGKVYTKQIANDGTALLRIFNLETGDQPQAEKKLTLDDVVEGVNSKFTQYESKFEMLEARLNEFEGGNKNANPAAGKRSKDVKQPDADATVPSE